MDKKAIKEIREKAILTQGEFAEKLGVALSTVSFWECGVKVPSKKNTRKILAFCKENGIEVIL